MGYDEYRRISGNGTAVYRRLSAPADRCQAISTFGAFLHRPSRRLGFLAADSEKDALLDFIEKHDYLNRKGEVNMCQAINDLMRDEFQNGKTAGCAKAGPRGCAKGNSTEFSWRKKSFSSGSQTLPRMILPKNVRLHRTWFHRFWMR